MKIGNGSVFHLPKIYASVVNTLIVSAHWLNVWLLMPALLIIVLLDIVLRNLFSTTLNWSHEFSGLMLLAIFFLDIPYCLAKNDFLKVDIFYGYFSVFWKVVTTRFAQLGCLCIAVLLIWQAVIAAFDMIEFDDTALSLPIPLWPFSVMIAVSGVIMAMQALQMLCHPVETFSDASSEVHLDE